MAADTVCEPVHVISLGAGVQSSTMALMAAHGEITPMPAAAIFADTQAEPKAVYEWLNWLEKQLPFPVERVTAGSLAEAATTVRISKKGNGWVPTSIPAFLAGTNGKATPMRRQCTADFKITPIRQAIRRSVGRKGTAIQWIGISIDEATRMKDSRVGWITNRWPLIEAGMTRRACLDWMKDKGFPTPPRSACVFCPYHSDEEWRRLTQDELQSAAGFEKRMQMACTETRRNWRVPGSQPYLHRSMLPLLSVEFKERGPDLFENECEGVCGV